MAFVDPSQDPENQDGNNPTQADQAMGQTQNAAQPTQTPAQPSTGGGGGGANAGSSPSASAPGSGNNNTPQASATQVTGNTQATPAQQNANSGWTNLDQYLNANSDQATQMGQQIAQTVNSAGNQAQTDINNLNSGFTNAVNQNTVNQDPNAVNQAVSDATSLTAGQNLSAADQQAFGAQANANYKGPTDVTSYGGYNQAQQDLNQAVQEAQQTGSEAGRGALLNTQYQNTSPTGYTQGENNLDQLLLQNSSGAQQALQPLANQWNGLTSALGNTVTSGDQAAQTAAQTDQATAAAANNALGTATTNWQNPINAGLSNLQASDTAAWNQLTQGGTITPQAAQALGINLSDNNADESHNYISANQMGNYFTQSAAPTLSSYATADQYAQAQALAQLAGQGTNPILSPGSIGQAGSAETAPAYTPNYAQYASDNSAAQAEYTNAQGAALSSINSGYLAQAANTASSSDPLTPHQGSQGFSSIPQAVSTLTGIVAKYGGPNPPPIMGGDPKALASWAESQLQNLNSIQSNYNLPTYQVPGGVYTGVNPTAGGGGTGPVQSVAPTGS